MLFAGFPDKYQKYQKSQKTNYVFEIWCLECSSLGLFQISEISEISEKKNTTLLNSGVWNAFRWVPCQISEILEKHYVFELWCLECSSLGLFQISEI